MENDEISGGVDQNVDEPATIGITTINTIAIRKPLTLTSMVTAVPGAPRPRAKREQLEQRHGEEHPKKYGDTR